MDAPLVRSPVYQQLNERLRALIGHEYRCQQQFLTEREIVDRFQVSRPTANKALAGLVSEGLLEFRKGVGTFVRRDLIEYDVRSLVSFTEKARAAGKKPSTELITFGKLAAAQADEAVCRALNVAGSSLLWEIERIRLADRVPVIFEHRYVVHQHCPQLTRSQARGSLYRAWTEACSLTIGGASEVIRAVPLAAAAARHLQVAAGSPAFEVISVGFLAEDRPLWWERTLYRGDQYEFHSRLGPVQSAVPARGVLRQD